MLSVEDARQQMLDSIPVLSPEKRQILDCSGYVLAEELYATENIPPFDNSAMDGFAVIAADVNMASKDNPVVLKVVETIAAGYAPEKEVSSGECSRIMTGAMIPKGANAVVMQEDTELSGDQVNIFDSVVETENVRFTGESVKHDDCVMSDGKLIRPTDISMLASLNCTEVTVYKKPTIAIVSTGDELTPIGKKLKPGKIRDSNRYGLYAQVQSTGGIPIDMGIAPDDEEETERIFLESISQADGLITSGGVSVGEHDVVKNVLTKLGEMNFWRVAMKPGKPQVYGFIDNKPIFGLPGNPVSSLVVFELFVRPALLKMAGHTDLLRPTFKAVLSTDVTNKDGRVNYMRAILTKQDDEYLAKITGPQGSGILHSLVLANGLITIPTGVSLKAGEKVEAQFIH